MWIEKTYFLDAKMQRQSIWNHYLYANYHYNYYYYWIYVIVWNIKMDRIEHFWVVDNFEILNFKKEIKIAQETLQEKCTSYKI